MCIWLLRIAAIEQLISGVLFWSGHAYTFVPLHMAIGSITVIALWTIAVIALVQRVRRGVAVFEIVWGLALAAFGATQAAILIGSMHWIVRVVHLLMAISAMEVGGKLGQAVLAVLPRRSREAREATIGRTT